MVRHLKLLAAGALCFLGTAFAQLPDATTLNGAYNVRYLGAAIGSTADTAISFQGSVTFDGKGGFTVTGAGVSAGATLKYQTTGTYKVFSSGLVSMTNPFADPNSATGSATIFGGVSKSNIVVGSSTEDLYNDLFIAIPVGTASSAATLSGSYRMAAMEFPNGDFTASRNSMSNLTADGKGGFGNVTIAGTAQNLGNTATNQTSNGATYTLTANGTGTLVFPPPSGVAAAQQLLSGTKNLFVSSDGNFFIAGNPTGYDLIVGVKGSSGTQMNGLYWSAYLNNYQAGSNGDGLTGSSGSANEIASQGNLEIAHERVNYEFEYPFDYTYDDTFQFDNTGNVTYAAADTSYPSTYAIGSGGDIVIGAGQSYNYLLAVYVKAPAMNPPSGTTVFLNPQGIVNAASYVPITAQIAPGTMLTLFGSGLGPSSLTQASSLPFPTQLGGVQVNINGSPAPIYYVSASQVSVVVPSTAPGDGSPLTFQVIYNGNQSNTVTLYSGATSPGAYSVNQDGVSASIVHHADGSNVTSSSPAKVGETVIMAFNGLGPTNPSVAAGSAGPSTAPLAQLTNQLFVYIDGVQATVSFAGLAPGFAGLYQLNVVVPSGVSSGLVGIEIQTTTGSGQTLALDSDNYEGSMYIQ